MWIQRTTVAAVMMTVGVLLVPPSIPHLHADDKKLDYANFELPLDQRPVSTRGGWIGGMAYQENSQQPVRFHGMNGEDPPAPAVKMTAKDGSNKAIAFEYTLTAPNQWAAVGVTIHGQPDADGKPQPDDVSAFKALTLQIFTKDVTSMRVEFISENAGLTVSQAPPQFAFRTRPGFNAYKVKLGDAAQPSWVDGRIDTKAVLKRLTAVNVLVVCSDCRPETGLVVLDNLAFEK